MKQFTPIKLTAEQAAREFNVPETTLRRRLSDSGHVLSKGKKYEIAVLYRALSGGLDAARQQVEEGKAEALERKNKMASGEIVWLADSHGIMSSALVCIRDLITALPATKANECKDPLTARGVLQGWVDYVMPVIRDAIDKYQSKAE